MRPPLTPVPYAKKTEPTRHVYAGHVYVNKDCTDIRATFERVRAEQQKPADTKNVATLKRKQR
jgi:hypothetical protein